MKLLGSFILGTASASRNRNAECGPIDTSSFWSNGHSVGECTDGNNVNSQCTIQCNPPYVSFNPSKPYDSWNVMCRKPANPQWTTSKFSSREDHNCYYCPAQTVQTKPRGSKIISTVEANGARIGMELKINFDRAYFDGSVECDQFVFGLRSTVPFPEDAVFTSLGGAEASFISTDRTLVTFQPHQGYGQISHPFWHMDHHDGTRVYISGSDLSSLKSGSYSIKTVVSCIDDATFNDMSCSVTPTEPGIALTSSNDCPDTTPITQTTTTSTSPETTSTAPPTTSTSAPTSTAPTTTSTTTTTSTAPPSTSTSSSLASTTTTSSPTTVTTTTGSPSNGCAPMTDHTVENHWVDENGPRYEGHLNLHFSQPLAGNSWYVDLHFDELVSDIEAYNGTPVMMDTNGHHWRITGYEDDTLFNSPFNLIYLARTTSEGGATPNATLCGGGGNLSTSTTTTHTGTTTTGTTTTTSSVVSTTTTSPPTTVTTTTGTSSNGCAPMTDHTVENHWVDENGPRYEGHLNIHFSQPLVGDTWYLDYHFDEPVSDIEAYNGTPVMIDTNGHHWRITGYASETLFNSPFNIIYLARPTSEGGATPTVTLCGGGGGGSTSTTTTHTGTTTTGTTTTTTTPVPCVGDECGFWGQEPAASYSCSANGVRAPNPTQTQLNFRSGASNYEKLLHMSSLFYEAQRAGPLPSDNRIPWRGHSMMNDGCDVNHDLTGGWFDAGDHVKFNFPMAFSVTALAWGIVSFEQGYIQAGELENALDSIKWATDYFIKCHTAPNELYIQTGEPGGDHSYWGRPEEYPLDLRPFSYKIDASNPGSDVAGETAAALAAASIAYRRFGATALADECLQHAEELFTFADTYRGKYSDHAPVGGYYSSYEYNDELVWGAAWIAKATNDQAHVDRAIAYYNQLGGTDYWFWSWDNKRLSSQLLMYELTGDEAYATTARGHIDNAIATQQRTSDTPNLIYFDAWAAVRHAMNFSFLLAQATFSGAAPQNGSYMDFARSQVNYVLGQNSHNQCYIVGYDEVSGENVNCPQNWHHRSSQCPAEGDCNIDDPNPNNFMLYGAVVGGPRDDGVFVDGRREYELTEVATDYNAGWQGLLAALIQEV